MLGVEETDGRAALPAAGLTPDQLAAAQKWIRGNCNRIDPVYQPVVSPEIVAGRHILVVWAPPSDTRPHAAPEGTGRERRYWIRLGEETVDAQANGMLQALLETTARVPWDDRRALQARVEDLRAELVREYLRDVRSGLLDQPDALEIYRRLLGEARSLLERVIQLEAPKSRRAWAWCDLGRTLNRLRAPVREIEQSYRRAIALLPVEERFKDELQTLRSR